MCRARIRPANESQIYSVFFASYHMRAKHLTDSIFAFTVTYLNASYIFSSLTTSTGNTVQIQGHHHTCLDSVTNIHHSPLAFFLKRLAELSSKQIKGPKEKARRCSVLKFSSATQNPGIRPTDSGINVDQYPLIQQAFNLRAHPLRSDAARLSSWSITTDTQDYH